MKENVTPSASRAFIVLSRSFFAAWKASASALTTSDLIRSLMPSYLSIGIRLQREGVEHKSSVAIAPIAASTKLLRVSFGKIRRATFTT